MVEWLPDRIGRLTLIIFSTSSGLSFCSDASYGFRTRVLGQAPGASVVFRGVFRSRKWPPTTVAEYAQMMKYTRRNEPDENEKHGLIYSKERGVDFTSKGDRLVVKYNFFKMTFDPQARAREDVH